VPPSSSNLGALQTTRFFRFFLPDPPAPPISSSATPPSPDVRQKDGARDTLEHATIRILPLFLIGTPAPGPRASSRGAAGGRDAGHVPAGLRVHGLRREQDHRIRGARGQVRLQQRRWGDPDPRENARTYTPSPRQPFPRYSQARLRRRRCGARRARRPWSIARPPARARMQCVHCLSRLPCLSRGMRRSTPDSVQRFVRFPSGWAIFYIKGPESRIHPATPLSPLPHQPSSPATSTFSPALDS
jgi:hypothetical protein